MATGLDLANFFLSEVLSKEVLVVVIGVILVILAVSATTTSTHIGYY